MLSDILDLFESIGLVKKDFMLESYTRWHQMEAAFEILKMAKNVVIDLRQQPADRPEDFITLVHKLQELSHGMFIAEDVDVRWVKPDEWKLTVSFLFNQHRYKGPSLGTAVQASDAS